jgi:hypothetical protein
MYNRMKFVIVWRVAMSGRKFWLGKGYWGAIWGAWQFLIFTVIAMFLYRGGTLREQSTPNYRFFENFFSDLGMFTAHSGEANTGSAVLFFLALTGAGVGLILYFWGMPAFFHTPFTRFLAFLGTGFGIIAGIGYIGIAFTPADLFIASHIFFVQLAFITYLVAVILYAIAILLNSNYPNKYAWLMFLFSAVLAGYVWLLFNGPGVDTVSGLHIQATGQKIIVYASIFTVLFQARAAKKLAAQPFMFASSK